eukprot:1177997-Prorocentrum_minimum.AAC.2
MPAWCAPARPTSEAPPPCPPYPSRTAAARARSCHQSYARSGYILMMDQSDAGSGEKERSCPPLDVPITRGRGPSDWPSRELARTVQLVVKRVGGRPIGRRAQAGAVSPIGRRASTGRLIGRRASRCGPPDWLLSERGPSDSPSSASGRGPSDWPSDRGAGGSIGRWIVGISYLKSSYLSKKYWLVKLSAAMMTKIGIPEEKVAVTKIMFISSPYFRARSNSGPMNASFSML